MRSVHCTRRGSAACIAAVVEAARRPLQGDDRRQAAARAPDGRRDRGEADLALFDRLGPALRTRALDLLGESGRLGDRPWRVLA